MTHWEVVKHDKTALLLCMILLLMGTRSVGITVEDIRPKSEWNMRYVAPCVVGGRMGYRVTITFLFLLLLLLLLLPGIILLLFYYYYNFYNNNNNNNNNLLLLFLLLLLLLSCLPSDNQCAVLV